VTEIRQIGTDELPAWVEMRNRTDPEQPTSLDETAFWTRVDPERANFVAYRDGTPVGAGFCHLDLSDTGTARGEGRIWVPPEFRGQGVGGGLLAACRDHLRRHGKEVWRAETSDGDPHTLRFLERRGFQEVARSQEVGLDLTTWEPPGWPLPDGIELTDYATRPDLLRGMSQVENEVVEDIPQQGDEPHIPFPFEKFQEIVQKPGMDPRLMIIGLDGDEVVGYAMLSRNVARPELGYHWLTGVRKAWRGRGVAKALKQAQLTAAKGLGIERVRTDNDLRNEPIRRLNEALGYTRLPDVLVVQARLEDIPDAVPGGRRSK